MGYSPEQYYFTLRAFADRCRPHFVVVSIFANDCGGEIKAASSGAGDWYEADYWLSSRPILPRPGWRCLMWRPVRILPDGEAEFGPLPGTAGQLLNVESQMFLDPMDDFLDEHMRSRIEVGRRGRLPANCYLFNDAIKDGHFSAAGRLWAESVGRRLLS